MAILTASASAENKATAEWLAHPADLEKGETIRTIIRMEVDEGWHTYWVNPGEGGMPPKLGATLPEGWQISEIQYPAPKRFFTGELPGFGYEGKVDFPVTITPVENAHQTPRITATLSWLTCDDGSCVPGDAELSLTASKDPAVIENAYSALAKPIPDASLKLESVGENLKLSLTIPSIEIFDPKTITNVFPKTPDTVDTAAPIDFKEDSKTPGTWTATVPKSEYLSGEPEAMTLVIATEGKDGKALWEITSSAD